MSPKFSSPTPPCQAMGALGYRVPKREAPNPNAAPKVVEKARKSPKLWMGHTTPHIYITASQPMQNRSVFELLIWTLKQVGFTSESVCKSSTVMDTRLKFTVISLACRKPKKPKQHAALSITWSLLSKSSPCWIACRWSRVIERHLGDNGPWTRFIPVSTCFEFGSWWKDPTSHGQCEGSILQTSILK